MTKIEITRDDIRKARAVYYSRDLASFVRAAWHTIEPGTKLIWNWHLDRICAALQRVSAGEIKRLVICVPPGTMKSVLVSVMWPAWEWLTKPSESTQFISNSDKLAARDSRRCRDVITSEWYQEQLAWLEADWTLKDDQNEKLNFATTAQGFRQCMSIGSKITGERALKQVVDDPHDVKEVIGGEPGQVVRRLQYVRDVYSQVLSTRINSPRESPRVVIMQRLHPFDLAGHCIEQGYTLLCYPMEYDPDHPYLAPDDPRTERGELLFPAFYGPDEVKALKLSLGPQYHGQAQQLPIADGEALFDINASWRFDRLPLELPGEFIQSWDFRNDGSSKTSSYAIGLLAWRSYEEPAKLYLVDIKRGQWTPIESNRIFDEAQSELYWRESGSIYIEKKADGIGIISAFKHKYVGIIAVMPRDSKLLRARRVQHIMNAGNVGRPAYAHWLPEFELEVFSYPGGARNDDQVDVLTQLLDQLYVGADPAPFLVM